MANATSVTQSSFFDAVFDLVDRGFSPIPCDGKRPLESGWTNYCDAVAGAETLTRWSAQYSNKNIGICTGLPVGEYLVVALDIDLDDWDEIQDIISTIPTNTIQKIGQRGITLLYRCAPELAKTRTYKKAPKSPPFLEFLSKGRQTIMPPSVHPNTGKFYRYMYNPTMSAHELPILTENHIEELEEVLSLQGWDRRWSHGRDAIRQVTQDGNFVEGSIQHINQLSLDNLPAWADQLGLYGGKWKGASYKAVNTLRGSSTGRSTSERKRNLSIHPLGIKDFGSDQTYSPVDLVAACQKVSVEDAATWLAIRVWEDYEDPSKAISAFQDQFDRKSKPVDKKTPSSQTVTKDGSQPKVGRSLGALPASCFDDAPGFIGVLANEVRAGSPRMPKTLALMTAISTLSALCSRRYLGETMGGTLSLTIYSVAMSQTGGGKDHAIKFGGNLLRAMKNRNRSGTWVYDYGHPASRIDQKRGSHSKPQERMQKSAFDLLAGANDFTGDSALISSFWRCACTWLRIDEFGSVFKAWSVGKGHTTPVTALMRSFYSFNYSGTGKAYAINQTVSEELRVLRESPMVSPGVTVFGVSTPEQMYDALDERMSEDGTINRFLIAREDAPEASLGDIKNALFGDSVRGTISDAVADEAIDIFTFGQKEGLTPSGYYSDLDSRLDVFDTPSTIVVETPDDSVKHRMAQFVHSRLPERQKEEERDPVARIGENMLRLAYLAAIADNPGRSIGVFPEVTHKHLDWAISLIETVEANLKALVADHIGAAEAKKEDTVENALLSKAAELVLAYRDGSIDESKKTIVRATSEDEWLNRSKLIKQLNSGQRARARAVVDRLIKEGMAEAIKLSPDGVRGRGAECVRFLALYEDA